MGQVQGLGTNTIAVIPGREPSGPSDVAFLFSDSLKEKDIVALKNKANVPGLKSLMPTVFGAGSASYDSNTYQTSIFGATELMVDIFDLHPQGEFFNSDHVSSRSDVAVLGSKIAKKLFEDEMPLDKKIKIKNRNFKVIGVLPETGGGSLFNFDDMVLVPYTTAQDYITGKKSFNRLIIQAYTDKDVPVTSEDIKMTLRESHGITDPDKDDFTVQTQQDLANRLSTITNALTYFLVAVASIALFVGGVGIMNIMLVSVTERTREIGLRKALGATDKDILTQFLLEAVLLTAMGGLIGIILGASLAFITAISVVEGLGSQLDVCISLGWSIPRPQCLGSYRSNIWRGILQDKLRRESPIEALRYE